jgi:hypothetical protein
MIGVPSYRWSLSISAPMIFAGLAPVADLSRTWFEALAHRKGIRLR